MPKISVIIPVYNSDSYLGEALDSVINQSFSSFEIICVDDCSTDNSLSILKAYEIKDERIKVYSNHSNLGISQSLNKAISLVDKNVTYIARMDSDDICDRKRFEYQIDFMTQNPKIDICGTFMQQFGAIDQIVKLPTSHSSIIGRMAVKSSSLIGHPTVMIRSSLLLENNLKYSGQSRAEDYLLWVQAYVKFGAVFANIPKPLLKYRVHVSQLSTLNQSSLRIDAEKSRLLLAQSIPLVKLVYYHVRYFNYKKYIASYLPPIIINVLKKIR